MVENTQVEADEIRVRFGPEAAEVVEALSEDPTVIGYAERKRALRRQVLDAGRDPVLIYAADRVANLRDWLSVEPGRRPQIAQRLDTSLEERMELWQEDLEELSLYDPELPFLAEIEMELRELRSTAAAL